MNKSQEDQEKPEENKGEELISDTVDETPETEDVTAQEGSDDGESADQTPEDQTSEETQDNAEDSDDVADDSVEPENDAEQDENGAETLATALATAPLVASGAAQEQMSEADDVAEPEADDDDEHDEHEENRRSFASRVLTWLILLLVGGGAALWGGPKIAPHLPNGLGPVKAWLMPGALETETRLAELEESLDARFESLELGVSQEAVDSSVEARVATAEERLDQALVDLGDKVEAADSGEIEGRLSQLEARIEGLTSQLEALSGLATDSPELSEEQLAQIDTFSVAVEGLRGEIGSLAEAQGALSQRIDDVEVTVERKLDEAEEEIVAVKTEAEEVKNSAVARTALTAIEAAVASGEPFEASLADLSANSDAPVPEAISAVAASGVAPLGQLRASFGDAALAAIQAEVRTRDSGSVGGRLASFLEAQVATRSLTPQDGDSTDAVLSRAEDALRQDNLSAAVDELAALADAPKAAMSGWINRARARVAANSALAELRGVLAAEN